MKAQKVIGYILLTPGLVSVLLFFLQFMLDNYFFNEFFFHSIWTGYNDTGGYTSALPFYFSLMAMAGAYLIKDNK